MAEKKGKLAQIKTKPTATSVDGFINSSQAGFVFFVTLP